MQMCYACLNAVQTMVHIQGGAIVDSLAKRERVLDKAETSDPSSPNETAQIFCDVRVWILLQNLAHLCLLQNLLIESKRCIGITVV